MLMDNSKLYSAKSKEAFGSLFLWENLSDTEKSEIMDILPLPENFSKGAQIYSKANFKRALGLLLAGHIIIRPTNDNSTVIKETFSPGVFGVAALFGPEAYISEITAAENCVIVFISEETLKALMQQDFRICENYIRFITERIQFLNREISIFTTGSAEAKLLNFVNENHNGKEILFPKSMTALSKTLAIGRSNLYRALDTLEENGIIYRLGDKWYFKCTEKTKKD